LGGRRAAHHSVASGPNELLWIHWLANGCSARLLAGGRGAFRSFSSSIVAWMVARSAILSRSTTTTASDRTTSFFRYGSSTAGVPADCATATSDTSHFGGSAYHISGVDSRDTATGCGKPDASCTMGASTSETKSSASLVAAGGL